MSAPTSNAKAIRGWAKLHGVDCPPTGPVPDRVRLAFEDFFAADHNDDTAELEVDDDDDIELDSDVDPDEPVTVAIELHDYETADIAEHIASALALAFEAGRDSMRAEIFDRLNGGQA